MSLVINVQKDLTALWAARPDSIPQIAEHYLYLLDRFKPEEKTDAFIGLRRAITYFDPSKNPNFEGYAQLYLKGSIIDGKRTEALFSRSRYQKQMSILRQIDDHYKQTGSKPEVDTSSVLYVNSLEGKTTLDGDACSPEEAFGLSLCSHDDELVVDMLIRDLPPIEQKICNLFKDGYSLQEIQQQTNLDHQSLADILVSIKRKMSDEELNTDDHTDYVEAVQALVSASGKDNASHLRDNARQIRALPIFEHFSPLEKKIVAFIEGGMSVLEIARGQNKRAHIVSKIWNRMKSCLTNSGNANYKARLDRICEKKKKFREWQLKHMVWLQGLKWKAFREKHPLPTKKELKHDLKVCTIAQIASKYHVDEGNVHGLIKKYGLEHIRNGKRLLTAEGRASRERFQKEKWDRGRPPKEEFAKDLQEMDWAQLSAKYGRSKYALTKYAKEMEIFHLKRDRDYEKARLGGIRGMASLKKKLADQYGAENVSKHWTTAGISTYNRPKKPSVKKHKPSIKDLIRRADRPFEDIAAEFDMTVPAIRRLHKEYKIMSIRRKKFGEKRGYEIQLKIFEEKGMTPPTAEQLLEWYNTLSWKDIKEKHGMERNSFMAYCGYIKCQLPTIKPIVYTESPEIRKAKALKKKKELDEAKRLVGDLLLITKESLSADISNGMSQQEILDKYRIGKPRLKRALNEFGLQMPRRQGMNEAERREFRQKIANTRGIPPLPSKEQLLEDIRNCSSLTEVAKKYQRTRGSITNAIRQWGIQESIKEANPKIYNKIQTGIETKERMRTVVFPDITKENLEKDVLTLGWDDIGKKYGKAASFIRTKCREFGLLENRPKKVYSDPNGDVIRNLRLFQAWEQKRREQNPAIPSLPPPKEFLVEMDSIGTSAMERKYMRTGKTLSNYRKIIEQMAEKGILHILEEQIVQPIADTVQAERTDNGE